MFAITLSGQSVEPSTVYATMAAAEHIASVRYNDPPVKADAKPHIPRRTWQDKGYRIKPANLPRWPAGEDREPAQGHECPARFGALAYTGRKTAHRSTYDQLCKAAYRERVESAQYPWAWLDAVDRDHQDRHDPKDNQEEPMAYGSYEATT